MTLILGNRCTGIRNIPNGEFLPLHRGAVIQFWCKPGFQLKGSQSIYCDGLKWSDNSPFCITNNTKPALSCDFENNNLCGWVHDLNHDFDWTRYNQDVNTWHIKGGPESDHTPGKNGKGYYMYIDASKSTSNETARFISPIYGETTTNTCLVFFYHMQHHGNGILMVHKKLFNSSWNEETLLFKRTGYQGNHWNRAFINLGVATKEYQVVSIRNDSSIYFHIFN